MAVSERSKIQEVKMTGQTNMKINNSVVLLFALIFQFGVSSGQIKKTTIPVDTRPSVFDYLDSVARVNSYDIHRAFGTGFYSKNGTEYRAASGEPGPKYWQNRADYELAVTLNEQNNEISGSEELTYTNNSPQDMDFLWMQLDQNQFRNNSRGAAILFQGSRSGAKGQAGLGFNIKYVQVYESLKSRKLLPVKFMVSDTRMQVFLPAALQGNGAQLRLKIDYSYTVPNYGSDRTGILATKNGKIYAVGQWYPRMCVFDDLLGWNTLPYIGSGQFYLEYGNFDIKLTVPASHIVVCSGELQNPKEVYTQQQQKRWAIAAASDSTVMIRTADELTDPLSRPASKTQLTWHFKINNARDAAWASSSSFIVDAAKISLPGGKKSIAISAYPLESDGHKHWSRSTQIIKTSIEHYSNKWFEYPYPAAINAASSVEGMEYPGIVFTGAGNEPKGLWNVMDHELGHTLFPMIVGSNERLHGWMDEGFDTFINTLAADDYNHGEYKKVRRDRHTEADYMTIEGEAPVMTAPDNMDEAYIAKLNYTKPAFGLEMLREQILGPERFDLAFSTYIKRWAFKHPTPDDFFRTMENVSGENLQWFWRGWFTNNWRMNVGVSAVEYLDKDPKKGALITIVNTREMPMPVILEVKTKSGKTDRLNFPVEIWQRTGTFTFNYPSTGEISSVTYDPDKVLPDTYEKDNVWKSK